MAADPYPEDDHPRCQSCWSRYAQGYLCGACRQRTFRRAYIDGKSFDRWKFEMRANLDSRRVSNRRVRLA